MVLGGGLDLEGKLVRIFRWLKHYIVAGVGATVRYGSHGWAQMRPCGVEHDRKEEVANLQQSKPSSPRRTDTSYIWYPTSCLRLYCKIRKC